MMSWLDQAACLEHDTDDFFPDGVKPPAQRQVAAAKEVCSRCPVRTPCLILAVTTGAVHGVWGGLTEDERRTMKRRQDRRRLRAA